MRLYHGTSEKRLARILEEGLKARNTAKGNFAEFPSRKDLVYLTTTWALWYAIHSSCPTDRAVLLEIDTALLNPNKFYPDEDVIASSLANKRYGLFNYSTEQLKEVQQEVIADLIQWRGHWEKSLQACGNCAFRGRIPMSAITRYVLFDTDARSDIMWPYYDCMPNQVGFQISGAKHQEIIAWLFGDKATFGDEYLDGSIENVPETWLEFYKEESANRSGIEVVECGEIMTTKTRGKQ